MNQRIGPRALGLAIVFCCFGGVAVGQQEHLDIRVNIEKYRLASALYNKALEYFAEHDYGRARKKLEECLEKMPEHSQAHFLMAKAHYVQGRYDWALDSMEKAEGSWETTATLLERQREQVDVERRRSKDRLQNSINELRGQLSRTTSQQQRDAIEAQIGQTQQTIDDIDRRLLETFERSEHMPADYCFIHGNILLRLQRFNEAAAQYLQALSLDPAHPEATNNLASLFFQARQYEKALEIIEQAEAKGVTVNPELKKSVLGALQP